MKYFHKIRTALNYTLVVMVVITSLGLVYQGVRATLLFEDCQAKYNRQCLLIAIPSEVTNG